jgi:SpoVK/Ycf46/Vps4 family AAA+-type ATPase
MSPSILIIEDLDKFFIKNEEDSPINFDDKKTRIYQILKNEVENLNKMNKIYKTKTEDIKSQVHPIRNKSLVICTCSNFDKIDMEIKKPGNIDYVVNLNPPNQSQRKKLFQHFSKFFKNSLTEEDFEILADKSHGFIPTDIIQIFK